MCGIAGLVAPDGLAPDDLAAVARMTDAQVHRGPNGSGIHSDGTVVLGHRRLSIIDLSVGGAQPMSNEDGSLWLTYNGEIYNYQELRHELQSKGHRFRSGADTEVILHGYEQWGLEGLLDRLRGMFAFGLYDPHEGLCLARDGFGIKPLYYHAAGHGRLLFASEVKALLHSGCIPNERDPDAITGFLLAGSIPSPATMIKGIASLPPGHYLRWSRGEVTVRQYWALKSCPSVTPDFDHLRSLLQESVTRQLVSDVPVGVFLSGGLDSGAIALFASRALAAGHPLTTLTVTFDQEEFNEAQQASDVARHFRTNHHEVRITRNDFLEALPHFFQAMDQPTNDGVNTYFVAKAARQAGLTVVLSGLGGDEIFWGYQHYRWLQGPAGRLAEWPKTPRKALVWAGTTWGELRGKDNWLRLTYLGNGCGRTGLYLALRGFFAPQHVRRLLEIDQTTLETVIARQFADSAATADHETAATGFNRLEFGRYLHDQLLRDTDVFSMAHSLEVRVPLLDPAIVEYAASIRPDRKTATAVNKPLLVGALDDALVASAGTATKRGFSFPMARWMREAADELEALAMCGTMLNPEAVQLMWRQFRAGRLHWSRAWALSVLGATVH